MAGNAEESRDGGKQGGEGGDMIRGLGGRKGIQKQRKREGRVGGITH